MKLHLGRPAMRDLCPVAIISLGLVVAACGGSSGGNGTAGVGNQASGASAASSLDQPAVLRDLLSKFPAELTDVDALADSLKTPAEVFAFVRDRIAFEPYRGIMKGAQGTLLTRGGNSVERALLPSLRTILPATPTADGTARSWS